MGESRRVLKVEKEVREIVADFLSKDCLRAFPGLVTVSRVRLTKDLRQGQVFVTAMGLDGQASEQQEDILEALEDSAPEIQFQINRKLRMKFCPKLTFAIDLAAEKRMHIEEVLHSLNKTEEER